MVERSSLARFLVWSNIRNQDFLISVHDLISIFWNGVNAFKTVSQAKFGESLHATGLKKFPNNPVWFRHVPLYQDNTATLLCQSDCERAAKNTCTNDNSIAILIYHNEYHFRGILFDNNTVLLFLHLE